MSCLLKEFHTRWNVSILRGNLHSRWHDRRSEFKAKLDYRDLSQRLKKTKMKDRRNSINTYRGISSAWLEYKCRVGERLWISGIRWFIEYVEVK